MANQKLIELEDLEILGSTVIDVLNGAKGSVTVADQKLDFDGTLFTAPGMAYALVNGWQQSVRDSVAGWATGKDSIRNQIMAESGGDRDRVLKDWAEFAGLGDIVLPTTDEGWTVLTRAAIAAQLAQKATDVYNGEIGTRVGGPRRSPEEREKDEIAVMYYGLAMTAKHPDGTFKTKDATRQAWVDATQKERTAKIKELRANEKFAAKVNAEYNRRHTQTTDDLGELAELINA